jgi:hypothetical protein
MSVLIRCEQRLQEEATAHHEARQTVAAYEFGKLDSPGGLPRVSSANGSGCQTGVRSSSGERTLLRGEEKSEINP